MHFQDKNVFVCSDNDEKMSFDYLLAMLLESLNTKNKLESERERHI